MINKFANLTIKVNELDPLFVQCLQKFIEEQQASITMLQRIFSIGYVRASKIMEQMEQYGFVSPAGEDYTRQILISKEDYKEIFKK